MATSDAREADDIQSLFAELNAEPGVGYADLQPRDHVAAAIRRWPLLNRLRRTLLDTVPRPAIE